MHPFNSIIIMIVKFLDIIHIVLKRINVNIFLFSSANSLASSLVKNNRLADYIFHQSNINVNYVFNGKSTIHTNNYSFLSFIYRGLL